MGSIPLGSSNRSFLWFTFPLRTKLLFLLYPENAWCAFLFRRLCAMEIKNIEVYANKINLGCCEHKRRQYKYFFGYVGFKCCKVAMCLDCEKVQFVGNFFWKIIYLSTRKFFRNRFELLKKFE